MKITKLMLEQIIKEETLKIQKVKILKEERNKIIKQLNELYEEEEESVKDEETVEEGKIGDFFSGVSKYKRYWKPAFEYYRKGGKNKLASYLANIGTKLEANNWDQNTPNYNNFTEIVESYIVALKGRMVPGMVGAGGTSTDAGGKEWIINTDKEYENNPTVYDSKIAEFAGVNPNEVV